MQGLERRQRLIVIPAQSRIISVTNAGSEQRVRRDRPVDEDPVLGQLRDRGLHHPLLLVAQLTVLARVRVEPRERDARRIDAEIDRTSTRLNSRHYCASRMPSSA